MYYYDCFIKLISVINKLESTPIRPQYFLDSVDISSLYTNVPVKDTKDIIANNLVKNEVDLQIRHELLNWYDTITQQNYFLITRKS